MSAPDPTAGGSAQPPAGTGVASLTAGMQGASRDAVAAARERLAARTGGGSAGAGGTGAGEGDLDALGQLADDLFALATLLDREVALRRALADPGVDGDRKATLAERLLAGSVQQPARETLDGLVRSRWSRPRDLVDTLDLLGVEAVFAVAVRLGELDEVEDELFRFGRLLEANPALRMALTNVGLPVDRRSGLLEALLADRARPATVRLLDELVRHPRGRSLDDALAAFAALAAEARDRVLAQVRSAVPLTPQQADRLAAALERLYGTKVALQVEVAPDVVGGLAIRVGDEVIDGTVAGRLDQARRRLAG